MILCGGFRVAFEGDQPVVRLVPGARPLPDGAAEAVLRGLDDAPLVFSRALGLRAPRRPYGRVEVVLAPGELTQGEAQGVGSGSIRLILGEAAPVEDAARIARHEALHLLLAATLRGGERWNDPELAFVEWIVRGLEGQGDARVPRFQAPLPQVLDPLPLSRVEVQQRLAEVSAAPESARRYFGERLFSALTALEAAPESPALVRQRQLWLVEAALGAHYLEAASRLPLDDGQALRPVLLDDWLLDYEQYARAVSNAPSVAGAGVGAGNLWRLDDAGWSRDPLVRLSVAAQALQRDDHCFFESGAGASEQVVWKNRGRVRLPLLPPAARPRSPPLQSLRAVLRGVEGARALALLEDAARDGAQHFEARALWPRTLARLLAAGLPLPEPDGNALPCVQLVDGHPDAPEAWALWRDAAAALSLLLGERTGWVPPVLPPAHPEALAEAPAPGASVLLVHAGALSAARLLAARRLAADRPIRGALFASIDGAVYEELPDLPPPLDPRYREGAWVPAPLSPEALVAQVDRDTREGLLTTPLSHLLSMMAPGLEECFYPRAR